MASAKIATTQKLADRFEWSGSGGVINEIRFGASLSNPINVFSLLSDG